MPRTNITREIDRGWQRIQRELKAAERGSVKIGIQDDAGDYDIPAEEGGGTGPPLVAIAFWNEYGTSDGRIPSRPFMRKAFDEGKSKIDRTTARLLNGIYVGQFDAHLALTLLGQLHESQVRKMMTDIRTPPNAPSTIDQKKSSNPLIDTGQTRQSIRYEVES